MPAVMTLEDAARVLDVHPNTVRNWIRAGLIRGWELGKVTRPLKEDVEKLLAAGVPVVAEPAAIALELEERAAILEKEASRLRAVAGELRR